MLGLGNSITSDSGAPPFSPTDINALVGWWDFTDIRTLWRDESGTAVTTDGNNIAQIDNKAYTLQGGSLNAIGTYLRGSLVDTTKNPLYKTNGQNGHSYGQFDGSNDYLLASNVTGSVATDKLSNTTLNGSAMTVFVVVKSDVTSITGDMSLFKIQGTSTNDNFHLYMNDTPGTDSWEWNTQDDTARTNTTINSGQSITNEAEYWTVELDSSSSSSFYRNGDTSDGVTNGNADNFNIDLSVDNTTVAMILGTNKTTLGQFFDGNIHEVIIYSAALTDDHISQVEDYLSDKYNL